MDTVVFDSSLQPVAVTETLKHQWLSIARLARFLGISGMVLIGCSMIYLAIIYYFVRLYGSFMPDNFNTQAELVVMFFGLVILGVFGILFFIHLSHIKFAIHIEKAIKQDDPHFFESAWRQLRNHFRWYGISLLVYLALLGFSFYTYSYYVAPQYY